MNPLESPYVTVTLRYNRLAEQGNRCQSILWWREAENASTDWITCSAWCIFLCAAITSLSTLSWVVWAETQGRLCLIVLVIYRADNSDIVTLHNFRLLSEHKRRSVWPCWKSHSEDKSWEIDFQHRRGKRVPQSLEISPCPQIWCKFYDWSNPRQYSLAIITIFQVDNAMAMIRADVKWWILPAPPFDTDQLQSTDGPGISYRRSEENRLTLRHLTALEILQCDLSLVFKYYPNWIQGEFQ